MCPRATFRGSMSAKDVPWGAFCYGLSMADLSSMPSETPTYDQRPGSLELGAFSLSLNVKSLDRSREFYEKLGFVVTGGSKEHHYLILVNGETVLGLFEGMFQKNMLTFNPGLTNRMARLDAFEDVRDLQAQLKAKGLELKSQANPDETGPASLQLEDPDGNPILIDQFFDRPE